MKGVNQSNDTEGGMRHRGMREKKKVTEKEWSGRLVGERIDLTQLEGCGNFDQFGARWGVLRAVGISPSQPNVTLSPYFLQTEREGEQTARR